MRYFISYLSNGAPVGITWSPDESYDNNVAYQVSLGRQVVETDAANASMDITQIEPIASVNAQFSATLSANSIALALGSANLSPVPANTTVLVTYDQIDAANNTTFANTDTYSNAVSSNAVTFTGAEKGTYTITLRKDGYDDATYTITVT